jgi:hypothetical protein
MKLNKAGLWVWPASLGAGFSLAYSTACHWFGFLSASKTNRVEMLAGFGVIFSVLCWLFLKRGPGIFSAKISWRQFYAYLGAALVVAGAAAVFVLPLAQNPLILQQAQAGGTLTTITRFLWMGLKLTDFVSLAGLLLIVEITLSVIVSHWGSILHFIRREASVSPAMGIVLVFCLLANLYFSTTDKQGTLRHLKPLPSNSLLSLVWTKGYMKKARGYTLLFENYPGWTLVAPGSLLQKMGINDTDGLKRWGRLGSVVTVDYPTDLSKQEMQALSVLKRVTVENGSGLHYIAILQGDTNRNICLRTYKNDVFMVPVSLSPVCEGR